MPVWVRIHELMEELSEAERRVAREVLADYPASGLRTSHSLAAAAGVSAPTVVRFANHLGFNGYTDMQYHLHDEVSDAATSPVMRTAMQGKASEPPTPLGEAMRRRSDIIRNTLHLIPNSEVESGIMLIADCPKQVAITGGFFSTYIAHIVALQLSQVRPDVLFVEEPLRHDAGVILDLKRGSVLVLYDLRRYESAAIELARDARAANIDVVLITDRWMSPAASTANVVMPVDVEAVPFDSFVALLALSEVVVEGVMTRRNGDSLRRMKQWEVQASDHILAGNNCSEGSKEE
jgi:DNA-binding MurR/RpiR family transcriptional regulator